MPSVDHTVIRDKGGVAISDNEFIDVSAIRGIATVTLNRQPLNILNNPMMAEINTALDAIISDDGVRAIVFRAKGKAFSAGVDVSDHTAEKVEEMIHLFHGIFRRLAATNALTIAAVQGAAFGGGCEIACFCDIVLASERAKFGQPEVQVGVFPPVAASILPRKIGLGRAIELVAIGQTIKACEAHRIGLVNQVYPANDFELSVNEYLAAITALSTPVVRLAKKATIMSDREDLLAHLDRAEKIYLDELMHLHDSHEGIAAFLEKRSPVWQHA